MEKIKKVRLKVGDVFEIILDDGTRSYGQFCLKHRLGPMVRIFNIVTTKQMRIEDIIKSKLMFPPIFVGLNAAVREGVWSIIGHAGTEDFIEPKFKSSFDPANKNSTWYVLDNGAYIKLGKILPPEYKNLETSGVWSAYDVNERIKLRGKLPKNMEWMI